MNPAKLMLSAAITSLMLFSPTAFTTADAASIKIKPQVVKVKPKIRIAKPKVRVKVRAAKVRIKPKVKVRAAKVRIKPKVKVRAVKVRVKPKAKIRLANVPVKQRIKIRPASASVAKAHIKPRLKPKSANLVKTIRLGSQTIPVIPKNKPSKTPKIITNKTQGLGKDSTFSTPTRSPNTPELNVPGGFVDVFKVSGGNINDALRHADDVAALMGERAIPDLTNSGFGDEQGTLPGGDGLGRKRFAPGMEPAPIGAAGVPNPGGKASSDGNTSRTTRPTRYGDSILVASGYTNSDGNRVHATTEIIPGPTGTTRINTVTTYYDYADGTSITDVKVTTTTSTDRTRTEHTEVEPAEVRRKPGENTDAPSEKPEKPKKQVDGGTKAGGGDQGGNYIPPSSYSGTWNPMNGEVVSTVTPFDRISQPDNRDGTTNERSARPNVGAAAVTNTGDGGFAAGSGGSGGGRGFSVDHCITVSGCGGVDPDSPGGPEGTVADAGNASSY